MKSPPLAVVLGASCALALLSLLTPSCAGSATTGTGAAGGTTGTGGASAAAGAPNTDTCTADTDCTWGEIPNEILKATDCMCLYGCVYLPQTAVTAQRREQQHQALCKPNVDGQGLPCGIDDCAGPGAVACIGGTCKAALSDAGPTR